VTASGGRAPGARNLVTFLALSALAALILVRHVAYAKGFEPPASGAAPSPGPGPGGEDLQAGWPAPPSPVDEHPAGGAE
jgi:hypothetical protein